MYIQGRIITEANSGRAPPLSFNKFAKYSTGNYYDKKTASQNMVSNHKKKQGIPII